MTGLFPGYPPITEKPCNFWLMRHGAGALRDVLTCPTSEPMGSHLPYVVIEITGLRTHPVITEKQRKGLCKGEKQLFHHCNLETCALGRQARINADPTLKTCHKVLRSWGGTWAGRLGTQALGLERMKCQPCHLTV